MHPDGFIVLLRRMQESWIWQLSPSDFKVAVTTIFMANWTDGKWFDGHEMIFVPRGTFVSSIGNIAKKAGKGVTDKMVRGCLRRLEVAEFLKMVTQRGKRYSVVTIVNYEEYQTPPDKKGKPSGELRANSGRTQGELRATIEPSNKGTKEPRNQTLLLDLGPSAPNLPDSRFEAAYQHYPRKQGKAEGLKKAKQLITTDAAFKKFGQCIMAMEKAWDGFDTTTCPHFSTFVNKRRWEDEVPPLPGKDVERKKGSGAKSLPAKNKAPTADDRPEGSGQTNEEWEAAQKEKLKAMGVL